MSDKQYLNLLNRVLCYGEKRSNRTEYDSKSLFGETMRFDLQSGFPLLTSKFVNFKAIVHELLWFIKGSTNVKELNKHGVNIWNEWADDDGELGPTYGRQWRGWVNKDGESIDQLAILIDNLKNDPYSRRHVLSAWNVGEISEMKLPPCHVLCQFYVSNKNKLSCQFYQRSVDVFLGLPFNIASYGLLTEILANITGYEVGKLIFTGGDVHIYSNHVIQATEQLKRRIHQPPTVKINKRIKNIDDISFDDIILENYKYEPAIKGKIAV